MNIDNFDLQRDIIDCFPDAYTLIDRNSYYGNDYYYKKLPALRVRHGGDDRCTYIFYNGIDITQSILTQTGGIINTPRVLCKAIEKLAFKYLKPLNTIIHSKEDDAVQDFLGAFNKQGKDSK